MLPIQFVSVLAIKENTVYRILKGLFVYIPVNLLRTYSYSNEICTMYLTFLDV